MELDASAYTDNLTTGQNSVTYTKVIGVGNNTQQ